MATLKGLFGPKPRTKRNFLLENKQEVKVKSISNSLKSKVTSDLPQKQRMVYPSSQHSSKSQLSCSKGNIGVLTSQQKVKGSISLRLNGTTSCHSKREPSGKHDILASKHTPKVEASSRSRKTVTGSQTVHYSDQENVPFQWTEVCPSLISHNICHQAVQTEDCKSKTFDELQRFDSVDRIDKNDDIGKLLSVSTTKVGNDHEDQNSSNCVLSTKDSTTKTLPDFENLKIEGLRKLTSSKKIQGEPVMCSSSYQKGVIPKYLCKRKAELAEASARAREIDPNCPEGHVAMPDDERRETLDLILKNYNELISELNKIPVRTDTLKMKQRKIEIEKQLDKLEGGIRIFSRSKVYVKLDA